MIEPARVLTLAIESSNPTADPERPGSVAVGSLTSGPGLLPPAVIASRVLAPTGRHDDALAPAIDALLREANIAPKQIGLVAVSVGPGGYTALRIAVTTGMLFAEAVGAKCVRIPTARVAAIACGRLGPFVVALASKRDTTWATLYDRARPDAPYLERPEAPGALMDADALAALHARRPFAALVCDVAHAPAPITTWAARAGVALEPLRLGAESCLHAAAGIEPVDPVALSPIYPREPEAVSKWNAMRTP